MTTRTKMLDAINDFCDKHSCTDCPLKKFNDCTWGLQPDSTISVAYDIVQKNGEARLDGSHLKEQDDKPDMVNHPSRIIEEMRRLFELFDDDVKIFVNKSNKTVDIKINM